MLNQVFVKFNGQAEEEEYPASARALGNALIYHWNEKFWKAGVTYSDRMLAEITRLPKSSVQRARQFLIDNGWITVELFHGKTVYHLVFAEKKRAVEDIERRAEEEEATLPSEFEEWMATKLTSAERARLEAVLTARNRKWVAGVYEKRKGDMAHPLQYLISIAKKNPKGQQRRAKRVVYHTVKDAAERPKEETDNGTMDERVAGANASGIRRGDGAAEGEVRGQVEFAGETAWDIMFGNSEPEPRSELTSLRGILEQNVAQYAAAVGSPGAAAVDVRDVSSGDELREVPAGGSEAVSGAGDLPGDEGRQNEDSRADVQADSAMESSEGVSGTGRAAEVSGQGLGGLSDDERQPPRYQPGQVVPLEDGTRAVFSERPRPDGSLLIKIHDADGKCFDLTDTDRVAEGRASCNGIVYPNFLDRAAPGDAS